MAATMVPVSVIMVVVVAIALGLIGSVEVVSGIEAATPMAVSTLEGHEHCATVEEHSSETVACVVVLSLVFYCRSSAKFTSMKRIIPKPKGWFS